jgi:xanthine dehydrogenase molybdopterin binding subunit
MTPHPEPSHHDSAVLHVTGQSVYVNDIPASGELLHGRVVYSPHAHALIKSFNLEEARQLGGVKAILSAKDIPGINQMGPVVKDEACLADGKVECCGQAIFLIAAVDRDTAMKAEKLIDIEFDPLPAVLDIETAIEKGQLLNEVRKIETGNVDEALEKTGSKISGQLTTGAQEHWYLETQSCLCVPQEGREMKVYSSTQHPSETQAIVAEVLGITRNEVTVEVKRIGGAFGGKETQANHVAAWAALLANATGCPVKIHLFRDDDQIITGKRHPFLSNYKAAFTQEGKITALDVELNTNGGIANDLSMAILERAMFHVDNAYYIPNLRVIGKIWKTNLPSNTAFRGFGGPQGMAVIETVIDRIARLLKKDPTEIRKLNFYGKGKNNITHYGQIVANNRLELLYDKLIKNAAYGELRKECDEFNHQNEFYKKGLALTPVKFGISFTTSFLNQAGALVNIYKDGTVLVNHGGTEMGQGLHSKMLEIAAKELGIDEKLIRVSATDTSKVPNTSATAASSGSDLNGMAVKNAIDKIKIRLSAFFCNKYGIDFNDEQKQLTFNGGQVFHPDKPKVKLPFIKLVEQAYLNQISLSATGFYRTPDIHYNKDKGRGKPFHYFSFGMAVTQVLLDTLTGHHEILKTYIVQDVGDSINHRIDIGQVEGGFIQGVGWCTTEDIKWDSKGRQLNHSPDTYKIPGVRDIPKEFHVELLENVPNPDTIRNSKAVGEPPFMLAFSVWLAIKDAISAVGNHRFEPVFQLPATNEVIVQAIEEIRRSRK